MPTAIQAAAQPKPDYSRLTRDEINSLISLHKAGKTQTEIAQILQCSVPTVHDWVHKLTDTTDFAKLRARNLAARAVEKLDEAMDEAASKGRSAPQEAILKLAGLLEQESTKAGVTVLVGGQDATVQVQIGPEIAVAIQTPMHSDAQVIDVQQVTR